MSVKTEVTEANLEQKVPRFLSGRYVLPAVSLLLCLQAGGNFASAEAIFFSQAWREVQAVSNILAAERANIDSSQLKQDAAKGMYFPRVDLSGAYTRLNSPVEVDALDFNPLAGLRDSPIGQEIIDLMGGEAAFTTDITEESFGNVALTAIWPVYTGGRITAVQDVMAAETDIAQQMLDTKSRTVFEEVVRVYFGTVLAEKNLETHIDAEAGLLVHLENARKLEEQGQIAKVERLAVEAAHDRSTVATAKATRGLEIAQITLQQLLHRETIVEPVEELFTNRELPEIDSFTSTIIANSPVLKVLEARDIQSQAILKAQRGRFHPEVFLFGDYAVYKDDSIASNTLPDWKVGVGVTLTLVDRVNRSKTIRSTKKTRLAIAELEMGTQRALMVAAHIAHKEAYQALQEHNGLYSSLALAQENLRLRTEAFGQGFSTSVELIDAQLFIAMVETAQSAAAYQYIVSLARLLSLSGEPDKFAEYQKSGIQTIQRTETSP